MENTVKDSPSALSIAIIGTGQIGSAFAYQLAHAGHDVTVIARPGSKRLQQLKRDNGIVLKTGERAEVQVGDNLNGDIAYDLVIVTVRAFQIDALLPALQRSKAKCIHCMFNIFDPERLNDAIGNNKCSFGMPFVAAKLDMEGKLDLTVSSSRKTLHGNQKWVALFNSAGISSAYEPEMLLWLRCHTPFCIALESIAVAGKVRGGGASWTEAKAVTLGLKAGFAIIKGLGYDLYPSAKAKLNSFPNFLIAFMLWLFSRIPSARELLANGIDECRALIDTIVAASAKATPPISLSVTAALTAIKPKD